MTFRFMVVGDPQYFQQNEPQRVTETDETIERIKQVIAQQGPVVLGVIVVGDLMQTGDSGGENLKQQDFGKFKEKWTDANLGVSVLEGYGNHDQTDERTAFFHGFRWDEVVEFIKDRNKHRLIFDVGGATRRLTAVDENNGHYAWEWGNTLFINLNDHAGLGNFDLAADNPVVGQLAAGAEAVADLFMDLPRGRQARASLAFLQRVLRDHVEPRQPVILLHHMSFDNFSVTGDGGQWWSPLAREALLNAVKPHNIVAMFSGHTHAYQHLSQGTYTELDGSTASLPFDNFVTDATFDAHGAQGFLEVEVDDTASSPTMTVTRHFSDDQGRSWQTNAPMSVSMAPTILSPNPLWSDAQGWDHVRHYSTIQLANTGSDLYLLARAGNGMHTWRFTGTQWEQVAFGMPEWSNDSGWDDVSNYATIQALGVGGVLHMVARADNGMRTWQLNGSQWRRVASDTPDWSDADNWNDVSNYSTIQAVDVGGVLHLLARAANGMHTWQLNGSQWTRVSRGMPEWSSASGWRGVDHYSTIQALGVGGVLHLLGRASNGIHTWRFDGSQWQRVASGMPEWSDANGWTGVDHYSTIQAVDVGGVLHLLARASNGIQTWRFDGSQWQRVASGIPRFSDANGWDGVDHYSTIQSVVVDGMLHMTGRGASGMHTWWLDGNQWTKLAGPSPEWGDSRSWAHHKHYSTIKAGTHDKKLILVGRAIRGIHTWWLDNRTWKHL